MWWPDIIIRGDVECARCGHCEWLLGFSFDGQPNTMQCRTCYMTTEVSPAQAAAWATSISAKMCGLLHAVQISLERDIARERAEQAAAEAAIPPDEALGQQPDAEVPVT